MLFNKSLGEATLPDLWKDANITPIFKNSCRTKPNNCHPVSLTSVICKMLETIIKTHIMDHLESNHLLPDMQYRFCSGRFCELQLLRVVNHWIDYIDAGKDIDILYLDLQKAFDKVPHKRLIHKLKAYGMLLAGS